MRSTSRCRPGSIVVVPPTVLREAQHGLGTVQLYVDHDPARHYFTIEGSAALRPQLQRIALLDVLINNADRKAGHVLIEETEETAEPARLWGIDHGICFHVDAKLRTVIWEFAGEPIPPDLLADLTDFQAMLADTDHAEAQELHHLLGVGEVHALADRLNALVDEGQFPSPLPHRRNFPWPPI